MSAPPVDPAHAAPPDWRSRAAGISAGVILACLALADGLFVAEHVRRIPMRLVGLFNEGWNAYHAERAMGAGPLYPEFTSLLANNYPPLSYYPVGAIGRLVGDQIVAGRVVSLVSLGVVAILAGVIVMRSTSSRVLGLFTGLLLVGFAGLHQQIYVAANDPQWLAHAVMVTGLLVFLLRRDRASGVVAVAALFMGAGLIKHSLAPLPVAVTVWLAWHDRSGLRVWLAACAGIALASAACMWLAYGADAFLAILASPREYELAHIGRKLGLWLPPLAPFLLGSIVLVAVDRKEPFTRLLGLYVLVSLGWGAMTLGGSGVSYNALFDLAIASMMATVIAIARVAERFGPSNVGVPAVQTAAMILLALPVLVPAPGAISRNRSTAWSRSMQDQMSRDEIAFLVAREGPVLCQRPALCYWAGKGYEVDLFNSSQKFATGMLDPVALDALVEAHYFAVLDLSVKNVPLPKSTVEIVGRHYEIVRRSGAFAFLEPREQTRDSEPVTKGDESPDSW